MGHSDFGNNGKGKGEGNGKGQSKSDGNGEADRWGGWLLMGGRVCVAAMAFGVWRARDMGMNRREFAAATAGALVFLRGAIAQPAAADAAFAMVSQADRPRILAAASRYMTEPPVTVTAAHSIRSSGGAHDYFSEGDYWWPDPKNPEGPYIHRDGMSNPANFNTHRLALIRLSLMVPALGAAWRLTKDRRYAAQATRHMKAWFVDPETRMNPNLQYAQAISGITKGRGTGVIDTVHLVEVVRAARVMEATGGLAPKDADSVRKWFAEYVEWMNTSKNGLEEKAAKNNHGSCWVLQAAEFAQFARRQDLVEMCRDRFKTVLIPGQVEKNGSLPRELARTKPYSYSLFDMDILGDICQSLSTPADNLWTFKGPNGAGAADAVAFMYPYIADKAKWPFAKDVEYFGDLPVRQPSLLFAGEALHKPEYIDLWKRLNPDPTVPEIIRNMPVRQPLLWVDPVLQGA